MVEENSTQPVPQSPPPGAPRWMRVTLVISLAFNLLIIGAFLGAILTGGGKWRGGGHADRFGGPLTRAFSEEDQRILKRRMAMAFIADGDARGAQRRLMAELAEVLRATPYDEAAVTAKLVNMRDLLGQRFDTVQSVVSDHLSTMSDTERATLADRIEEQIQRRR